MHYSSPRPRDASILTSSQENFATSVAFQDLVTNKRKHPDNMLLSYFTINSLRYKINE